MNNYYMSGPFTLEERDEIIISQLLSVINMAECDIYLSLIVFYVIPLVQGPLYRLLITACLNL